MTSQPNQLIEYLRRVLQQDDVALTDGQLLGCFIEHRDERAFAAIVKRHGRLVWNVCRRLFGEHDAEDAFQATFLVFCRKAGSVRRRERLASWLYGVAHQTALQARRTAARRRTREKQVMDMPEPAAVEQEQWRDLQPLLDQELSRLPEDYRVVLLLCDLEGKTRKEVARQLRLAEGTVASRLARARAMLAKRLTRHGSALAGATLAVVLSEKAMAASPPTSVMSSTIKAVTAVAATQAVATGIVSGTVAALTEGVIKTMLLNKLMKVTSLLLVVSALGGAAGLLYQTRAAQPAQLPQGPKAPQDPKAQGADPEKTDNEAARKDDKKDRLSSDEARLRGTWQLSREELDGQVVPARTWQAAFRDGKVILRTDGDLEEGTYTLNAKVTPKALDIRLENIIRLENAAVVNYPAIYRLEGAKLIVASSAVGQDRPRDFSSRPDGTARSVWTWTRVPADQELPAEQSRVRDIRLRCGSQMRWLLLAMHMYKDEHKTFPGPAVTDKAGKPLLSWRVALLPYLGETPLYKQFHLDEPWDSEHNLKLLPRLPKIYASVGKEPQTPQGTFIQALVGKDCFFEVGRQNRVEDIADGTDSTLALVSAATAVPWTKPADMPIDFKASLPSFAGGMLDDGRINLGWADGSVSMTSSALDAAQQRLFRAALTRNGKEMEDVYRLRK